MGSWYETCAISNLPIVDGDELYWLMLTKNPYTEFSRNGCYHYDFFFPRSIPILGTYADYGEVEEAKGEELFVQAVLDQFKVDLIPRLYRDYKEKDGSPGRIERLKRSEVTLENLTFDQLQNWLHEGHVFVDNNKLSSIRSERDLSAPAPVSKIMIRKDVWDTLIDASIDYWNGSINIDYFKEISDKLMKSLHTCKKTTDLKLKLGLHSLLYMSFDRLLSNPVCTNSCSHSLELLADKFLKDELNEKGMLRALSRVSEVGMMGSVLNSTRKAWLPTTGSGSQNMELEPYIHMYESFITIAKKELKKQEEEY